MFLQENQYQLGLKTKPQKTPGAETGCEGGGLYSLSTMWLK